MTWCAMRIELAIQGSYQWLALHAEVKIPLSVICRERLSRPTQWQATSFGSHMNSKSYLDQPP